MNRDAGPAAERAARAVIREEIRPADGVGLLVNLDWQERFPGLVSATTVAPPDFGLAAPRPAFEVTRRYEALARAVGCGAAVVARQVHGTTVIELDPAPAAGVLVAGDGDGLATDAAGVLLNVTVADCVPIHLLDPGTGALAILHAGWRGAADGILERGLAALRSSRGSQPSEILVYLGPSICGSCYEVGPEVLGRFDRSEAGKGLLDLRSWLEREALRLGVHDSAISRSSWCTRCSAGVLHSHRGSDGTAGRMVSCLGWRTGTR